MTLSLQPVHIGVEAGDGRLVFASGVLVAVLVRLCEAHDDASGRWFLEALFGEPSVLHPPMFDSLQQAEAWILKRLHQADARPRRS